MLKDLGLCVTLYDISKVEGGSVFPGDGAPHFTVCSLSMSCSSSFYLFISDCFNRPCTPCFQLYDGTTAVGINV